MEVTHVCPGDTIRFDFLSPKAVVFINILPNEKEMSFCDLELLSQHNVVCKAWGNNKNFSKIVQTLQDNLLDRIKI